MGSKRQLKNRRTVAAEAEIRGTSEDMDSPPVTLREEDGVLLARNHGLFRPGCEAFCRRLAEALAGQERVQSVQISLGSGTCEVNFEQGRVNQAEMADRFASAVRSAIDQQTHDGQAYRASDGWTTLAIFSTGEPRSVWEIVRESSTSLLLRNRLVNRDSALAKQVARAIAALPAVTSSRVNFWSHDLDVRFHPAELNATAVLHMAEGALREAAGTAQEAPNAAEADEPEVAHGLKRVWYLTLAGGSFGMTLVGFLVPGIPTIPFLLATSYYLARSSPALNRRLRRSRFFGPILEDLQTYGGLRPLSRIKLIGLTLTLGLVMLVLIGPPFLLLVLMFGVTSATVYLIMRIPGVPGKVRGRTRLQPALAGPTA